MKLALITDLHANRQALEAVLGHARSQGVERWALLGDFVGYGADPGWVVEQVRELARQGAWVVQGNHDAATVRGPQPGMREDAAAAVHWTRDQLDESQLAFLGGLPLVATEGQWLFVHANAYAPAEWGYVQGRIEAVRSLQATELAYTFCGHMHEQMLFHLSGTGKLGEFKPTPEVPIPLLSTRRWLAIAGSCGQPRDGNPAACYAVFDTAQPTLTFHRVPYDVEGAISRIIDAGLPAALAERLRTGS